MNKEVSGGLLLIDKPCGPTSHDIVAVARRLLGAVKAGHTGTLDPMASGLLVVLVAKATKLAPYVQDDPKVYEGSILLGVSTDTMDIEGEVTREDFYSGGPEEVREALASLVGEVEQVPPMYSAVKHGGKPLYHYARRGEVVRRKSRKVRIYRAELTGFRDAGTHSEAEFVISCSPGTYVRELASRVGDMLACGGTLSSLRRTSAGFFRVEEAKSLEALEEKLARGEECLLPLQAALLGYKRVEVNEAASGAAANGSPLRADMLRGTDAGIATGEMVAVFGGGDFLGMHLVTSLSPFATRAVRMM